MCIRDSGSVGPTGPTGPQGDKGATGVGYEYEHIALNPIARDEAFTAVGVAKAFVKVPTTIDNTYYLYSVESSFGATNASGTTNFRLKRVNAAGADTAVTNGSWSHAGSTKMDTHTLPDTTVDDLGGDFVYVAFTDGPTDASGYTATLIWKKKP